MGSSWLQRLLHGTRADLVAAPRAKLARALAIPSRFHICHIYEGRRPCVFCIFTFVCANTSFIHRRKKKISLDLHLMCAVVRTPRHSAVCVPRWPRKDVLCSNNNIKHKYNANMNRMNGWRRRRRCCMCFCVHQTQLFGWRGKNCVRCTLPLLLLLLLLPFRCSPESREKRLNNKQFQWKLITLIWKFYFIAAAPSSVCSALLTYRIEVASFFLFLQREAASKWCKM